MKPKIVPQHEKSLFQQHCSRRILLLYLLSTPLLSYRLIPQRETTAGTTDFVPERHGFHFRNSFVNVILDLPGLRLETWGRCGGMAYAALDYYFSRLPIPRYNHVPECEPNIVSSTAYDPQAYTLAHYIFERQIESMVSIPPFGYADKFLWYTMASDREVFRLTAGRELEGLVQWILRGIPVPLGLIGVSDVRRIGENHQVVACGYKREKITTIDVYDPNHPGQRVTLTFDRSHRRLQASTGRTWRGFFVREDYRPVVPPST